MPLTPARFAILRLARTAKVGPVTFRRLVARYGSAQEVIARWPEIAKPTHNLADIPTLEKEIAETEKGQGWFLMQGEAEYPETLSAIVDAPIVLTGLGDKAALSGPMVGIVGTRNASAGGMKWIEELAQTLAAHGQTIASGLARGMDGAAHTGALNAKGITVAVVGGGVDHLYPPEHRLLRERIIQSGGAIVSEQPWGTPSRAELFPRRNRIIAALSRAIVVAEASRHSGSLITAEYALEYGREVFAVPGSPTDPRAAGPNWLLKNGANLLENAEDILSNLAQPFVHKAPVLKPQPSLFEAPPAPRHTPAPDAPQPLTGFLSPTPTDLDDIIRKSGLPESELTAQLSELELLGHAARTADGRWHST